MPRVARKLRRVAETMGLIEDFAVSVGRLVRETRKETGFTQAELASMIGCSISTISRSESGADMPPRELLDAILVATPETANRPQATI